MLIQVKSTQAEQAGPGDRKRFEFSAERLTRLPAYFALLVVAIAAYIRSITTVQAKVDEEAGNARSPKDHATSTGDAQMSAQVDDLAAPGVDETETGSTGAGEGRRGLGVEQGNPWPDNFVVPDFPQFHFVAPKFQALARTPFSAVGLLGFPVNDNLGSSGAIIVPGVPAGPGDGTDPDDDDTGVDNPPTGGDDDDEDEDGPGGLANRAPVVMGPVRLNDVFAGQVVLISLIHLLRGATDPDGDALAIENVTIQGAELVATASGWLLQTRPGMVGPVFLTYRITDGEAWVAQTASLEIVRKTYAHTDDDDIIIGSPFDDDINGAGGNDLIDALEGNDHVEGGEGDDHINGGDGDDVLIGGAGNDLIFGGNGNDLIRGGDGHDRLFGEAGDDTIFGDAGNDYIEGGAGKDHLEGGTGNDALYGNDGVDRLIGGCGDDILDGGAGDDLLEGGADDDRLHGGDGNDVLIGGAGDDIVYGEAGDDTLVADAGDDVMNGGEGFDTLDLSAAECAVIVDVVGGTSYSDELGTDCFDSIESIVGGAGNDMFVVGGKAMVLSGGKGRDTFVFEVTDAQPTLSDNVVHKILDFVVGDRVRVRDYDLDRDARVAERNMFEAIYGSDDDDVWLRSDVPLQIKHERIDDEDWTIIVADLNGDTIYDLAINIQGVLLLPPENLA